MAMTYLQLGCWAEGLAIYLPLFVIGRVIRKVGYLKAIQPWRNLSYQLGDWGFLRM
jgi:hypothetical protein